MCLRMLHKNGFPLLSKSIYSITILEWQIIIQITRISNALFKGFEYQNICIPINNTMFETKFIFNFTTLFNLKKQLKIHNHHEFSKIFSHYYIFESNDNIFFQHFNRISNMIKNSIIFKEIEFSPLKKILFLSKKEDSELVNCLLSCISKEIKYLMNPIYLNLTELMMKDKKFLNELQCFANIFHKNDQRYIIFVDIRTLKRNDIEIFLEKLLRTIEQFHQKLLFFLLSDDDTSTFSRLFPLKLSVNFSEKYFLKLILEIICKDIRIDDVEIEERSLYFEEKCEFLKGNIKDTYSFLLKIINKFHFLNFFKKIS